MIVIQAKLIAVQKRGLSSARRPAGAGGPGHPMVTLAMVTLAMVTLAMVTLAMAARAMMAQAMTGQAVTGQAPFPTTTHAAARTRAPARTHAAAKKRSTTQNRLTCVTGCLVAVALIGAFTPAMAQQVTSLATDGLAEGQNAFSPSPLIRFALIGFMILVAGGGTTALVLSRRMARSSLFTRLFIVVAISSAFFSAVSSAIGFGLITSQENIDFFRDSLLPPAFGIFVFFLTVAIWVGGSELLRQRDWFRYMSTYRGPMRFLGDMLHFLERCIKLFVIIPILATVLFFVSTWTSVVGIGGVDAVRYTYQAELGRLKAECTGITAYRQKDFLFLDDLRFAAQDVTRTARREREQGGQTGVKGRGLTTDYMGGVAEWLSNLEQGIVTIIEETKTGGLYSPYDSEICKTVIDAMAAHLSSNAFENYDRWARKFEEDYENFRLALMQWRRDRRLENLLDQQLESFDRANPKPDIDRKTKFGARQGRVIDRYADNIEKALKSLIRKQRLRKPPRPIPSAADQSPERGLAIVYRAIFPEDREPDIATTPPSRTLAVVEREVIAPLSTMTPRDAVLKNFNIFSDIWTLALSWDYASYILLLAYLFFPSAERRIGYKN